MDFDREIAVLKQILATLIVELGSRCTIRTLGVVFVETFGEQIDLKVKKSEID
jgi:hypothetical protein